MKKIFLLTIMFFIITGCSHAARSDESQQFKSPDRQIIIKSTTAAEAQSFKTPVPNIQKENLPTTLKLPVTIEIIKFKVLAPINPVGLDNEGRVDTIPEAKTIGWYTFGVVPGENGNAILDGHRDWKGELGSFRNIERLSINDRINIAFNDGSEEGFKVVSRNIYPMNDVPDSVMDLKGEERTTLITCAGKFVKENGGYQNRVIVVLKKI